jgi:hypothetical protein
MQKVSELFDVSYGVNLELNALKQSPYGINFVSRTAKNNGVSAKVVPIVEINPIPAGTISVAGGGSVMASFLQTEPYYSGRDLYYLTAKVTMTENMKLYYCACLSANRYRYSYGRQANRTLKDLLIPSIDQLPTWINNVGTSVFDGSAKPCLDVRTPALNTALWSVFKIEELFWIRKGKRLTKANMKRGSIPFIGAIDGNNGLSGTVGQTPIHEANTITVVYNGNGVAEAFYQAAPYWASDDVNVLYPRFELTPALAMFFCTVFRMEKYRFSYGRKWHLERMEKTEIRLPSKSGTPDFKFMESYIKTLPFSSKIA